MKRIDRIRLRVFVTSIVLGLLCGPLLAQQAETKVAVVNSQRIVEESTEGKKALADLKRFQDEKLEELRQRQQEITELKQRLDEGKLSLAEGKIKELEKEYEERVIAFRRFQDDADRQLAKQRDEVLEEIESEVLEIIAEIGREEGYTLIFNKFAGGLVWADDAVDITDEVITRFNAARSGSAAAESSGA